MTDLAKLTVLVPESRELDLFAGMLEAEGAFTFRCPLVQILDLEDSSEADRWIEELIQRPFDDIIFLTGDGLRKLAILSEARHDTFIRALGKTRTITRGPKPCACAARNWADTNITRNVADLGWCIGRHGG